MTRDEWVSELAQRIGVRAPTDEEVEDILRLAATAAHASERTAAPVAAWMAGVSGKPLAEVDEAAELVAQRASITIDRAGR